MLTGRGKFHILGVISVKSVIENRKNISKEQKRFVSNCGEGEADSFARQLLTKLPPNNKTSLTFTFFSAILSNFLY